MPRKVDPAARAMISSANDRPSRNFAAAGGNQHGRGIDHGRAYKAAPISSQEKPA
jgi:hypothetical protein